MKIAFICNQNQARSQVLQAVFAKILDKHAFESFGLIAHENTPLPLVIESVFTEWDLDPQGRYARNMGLHREEILKLDAVVAITSFISDDVSNLGFQGLIVDLEREAELLGVEMVDPQLMPRRQCAFEIAKYVLVTYSAFQKLGLLQKPKNLKALVPERESSIKSAIEIAISTRNNGAVILNGDIVAPRNDLFAEFKDLTTKFRFDGTIFRIDSLITQNSGRILLPAHALMWPSRAYLSQAWANLINNVEANEITIITPPMKNKSGLVAESYLAALGASEIQIVS
jgi:protein-tyrosine-phosphatase